MPYVDGYVIPIAVKNRSAYRRMASLAGKVWLEYGALQYFECIGEDLNVKWGVPFPKVMKLKRGETALFSFIIFKSRADRDRVNARVMKDPRITAWMNKPMPFDPKRMAYGGFDVIVEA